MSREANEPSDAAPGPRRAPATSLTLLERLRDNEPEAWRTMVSLYRPLICHWCIRAGVRQDDVEDVAQEVFRVAAASIEKFRRERPGDSFRGWLRGVTRNFTLLYFRRQHAQPQASGGTDAFRRLDEVPDTEGAPSEDESPTELEGLHRRALELVRGQVEERTWQAFWLTTVEGKSPADVAPILGVSPTTVRTSKSRVLRRLKDQFGDLIH